MKQFYVNCQDDEEKYSALADIYGMLFRLTALKQVSRSLSLILNLSRLTGNVAIGSTFIFVHTREKAKFLKTKLEEDGHKVGMLTGELTTEERLDIIKRFREGDERVLITTNVTSRGIDIDQVTLVVNYDLPYDVFKKEVDFEAYLHRIGRCGRFGKIGFAISLINASRPRELEQIKKLENHFVCQINQLDPEDSDQFKDWQD